MRTSVIQIWPKGCGPDEIARHSKTPYCDCKPRVEHQKFERLDAQVFDVHHNPLPPAVPDESEVVIITAEPAFAV